MLGFPLRRNRRIYFRRDDNAKGLKPEVLQKMMRHRACKTTLGYINFAEQIEEAVHGLGVPDVLQKHGDSKAIFPGET